MRQYVIYGLYCPFMDEIHYVGKSSSYMTRPMEHLTNSHSEKINEWVSHLQLLGYKPNVKILEECEKENLAERELYWINKYKEDNTYLLNFAHNRVSYITNKLPKNYQTIAKQLGKTIKEERRKQNITQSELCQKSGISRNTLYLIESGNGGVTLKNMITMLLVLHLSISIQTNTQNDNFSTT
jgi:DNA-binding XRE family transcriptional regulator